MAEKGISRRELLKKGTLLGVVAWVTPVVQVVGMSPALAQTTSPVPCQNFKSKRAKAEWNETTSTYEWETHPGVGDNDCNDCGGAVGVDGAQFLIITGDARNAMVTVINPDRCQISEMIVAKASLECIAGQGSGDMSQVSAMTADISNVQVCFECCVD